MSNDVRMTLGYVAALLLAGCSADRLPVAPEVSLAPSSAAAAIEADAPLFSEWSAAVNVGAPVNSMQWEQAPTISRDGLTIAFHCGGGCPGSVGGTDLWVSHRATVDAPWGPRLNLSTVNTPYADGAPAITRDGHRLYFNSNRPGGFGGNDLYVSMREKLPGD